MKTNPMQAMADTLAGLTGAVMALAAEACQRDPELAKSLATTLAGLITALPQQKKASPQGLVLGQMQMVAEEVLTRRGSAPRSDPGS